MKKISADASISGNASPVTVPFTAYLAAKGFLEDLLAELGDEVIEVRGRLVLAKGAPRSAAWAQNTWETPVFLPIESIGDGARKLTAIQRNWHLHSEENHRRASLIQEKLPHVSEKPRHFGEAAPTAPLGSWTLWEPNLILASARCSSPFPDGVVQFHENKIDPPSRAYLKLWESFTLLPKRPGPGDLCLDLGSAPGGWTWVLASLGSKHMGNARLPAHRIHRRRRTQAHRHPAELASAFRGKPSPGLPHPGETPPRLRKAASFRRSRAHGPARLMDTVGAQPHPRFGPVLVAVPRRRGAVP